MKRILPIFCALTVVALAGPERNTYQVPSDIQAVTVYLDRALVERMVKIDLEPGESTLLLSELPANLWDDSLQVSGSGTAGSSILDVQSRNRFVTAEPSPEIRELEQKLEELKGQRDVLMDDHASLKTEEEVLGLINRAATTIPEEGGERPSFQQWRELLEFNAAEGRRIKNDLRENAVKTSALDKEIQAATQQLNEARGRIPGRRAVKEVEVRVVAREAGPVALTVAYTVPGANWTPTYRARLDSAARKVTLDYQAQVVNRTGEAWNNVALTLSTARPSAGGSAPEPMPWIVEEIRRIEEARMRSTKANAMVLEMPTVAAEAHHDEVRLGYIQTTVETGLTSASFTVAAPATIPADGSNHRVSITTLTLPAGLRHDTTPKYNQAVFLTAKVTNDSEYPLLGGPLAAFVDGAFIANSFLAITMASEEFELALGVDDGVKVERTLIDRFVEKTGLTNSGRRTTYEVALDFTNHKLIPITLELSEPLPVSRHEKIEVRILEPAERQIGDADDNSAFKRDNEGILTWTGSLAPGASKELTLRFSIEHPADMDISGIE